MVNTGEACEREFVKRFKQYSPGCYIKKFPDFKSAAIMYASGMPDYIVVKQDRTIFVECKSTKNKSISINAFKLTQQYEFSKIIKAGGKILVFIHMCREYYLINYTHIMNLKKGKPLKYEQLKERGIRI